MDQLWAPWRLDYIKDPDRQKEPPPTSSGCFLCDYREQPERDDTNFVVARAEHVFVVLNRFPYNNGHLLIAPLEHKGELAELSAEELLGCVTEMQRFVSSLKELLNADGFNIGLNLGSVAGAGLPGHLHWHVVPRWSGDSNFMTVTGDTNVIPQSLSALHAMLRGRLDSA
ncbi:AP-4-A phosphorylase [Stratiformator vulcanicus]|uniref:AP-4-A phosphorylase n=2 Tax=Stratiformator vulcanicus TaxID=2527980 RepID=A0A517QZT4_9PLAN|nr:AP-4-A phosphorylase [Stratiformator vulcanicus]